MICGSSTAHNIQNNNHYQAKYSIDAYKVHKVVCNVEVILTIMLHLEVKSPIIKTIGEELN